MNNKENGKLIYIPIEELHHHPDNPRKALGDLEELTDSIKKNGVLQNLTVVRRPIDCEGGYYVVIGNRRMEAAKAAGLKELPCIVADMTLQEQVSTMLVENMQRSDLTVYEQAQGFQMMLDFGDSIESIAEKSGFSQSTIRRRVKLLELDRELFQAAESRGASLTDCLELDKIKDPERKNRVLRAIGTENFKYMLKSAIDEEAREERIAKICAVLDTFATKVETQTGYRYVKCINNHQAANDDLKPDDADEEEYFYYVTGWHSIYLLKKEEDCEESESDREEEDRVRQEREKRRVELDGMKKRAYELRRDFLREVPTAVIKKHFADIIGFWLWCEAHDECGGFEQEIERISGVTPIEEEEGEEVFRCADLIAAAAQGPERMILKMLGASIDGQGMGYVNWSMKHSPNMCLDYYYDLLEKLGYKISDEEKMLCNGTHPLFEEEK